MLGIPFWLIKVGGIVAIVAAVWGHGYVKGGNSARAACEEKARQAQVAADKQDKTADERKVAQEKVVDVELIELSKKQAARIEELEKNAQVTSPSCIYPMPAPKRNPPAPGLRAQPAKPRAGN